MDRNLKYKILLVGSFQYSIYASAFESGFKDLGYTVRIVDTNKYRNKYLFSTFLNKVLDKYHIGWPLMTLNHDILRVIDQYKPDFIFFYYCMGVYPSTYMKIKKRGIKFFTYINDDPFSKVLNKPWCRNFHRSLPIADWNFVYRKKNISDYHTMDVYNVSILAPYYIKKQNYPMDKERSIPIAFMGHWENDGRDEYLKALLNAEIPFIIYGDDATWKKSSLYDILKERGILSPRKIGEEYNSTINDLQLSIVFLSKINNDTYTRRCFEIPATKTCMICEYTDDMNNMFPEDECAIYFRNPKEFVEKVKYYITHPAQCRRIGENSYKRLLSIKGSEIDRCYEIIEKYRELCNNI